MAYRYDMRNKSPQQRAIVAARDKNSKLSDEKRFDSVVMKRQSYKTSIFMKLGKDRIGDFDAFNTMRIYQKCIQDNKETWFSTNALATGMSKAKQNEFMKVIHGGQKVYIYFLVGKAGGGSNEIEYRAEAKEFISQKGGIKCPNIDITPDLWKNESRTIWIRISKLEEYKLKSINGFCFAKNGKSVSEILGSNCCFGYIEETEKK